MRAPVLRGFGHLPTGLLSRGLMTPFSPVPPRRFSDALPCLGGFRADLEAALSPESLGRLRHFAQGLGRPFVWSAILHRTGRGYSRPAARFWRVQQPMRTVLEMVATMVGGSHHREVLRVIVLLVAVDVMHVFLAAQQPAKRIFNDRAMFGYVPFDRARMIRTKHHHVTIARDVSLPSSEMSFLPSRIVPADEESRTASVAICARNAFQGDGSLLPAATETQPVRRVVGRRFSLRPGIALSFFRGRRVHLMAGNESARNTLADSVLEGLTTATCAHRHAPSIGQIGAI